MLNRFSRCETIVCFFGIFLFLTELWSQDVLSNEYVSNQGKETLDLNKVNSSVDAGAFYSIDVSIKQLEGNMAKMAQELKQLRQHVELAKLAEQKRILHVQNLEKENIKTYVSWPSNSPNNLLSNSMDTPWTASSSKIESSADIQTESKQAAVDTQQIVRQDVVVQVVEYNATPTR